MAEITTPRKTNEKVDREKAGIGLSSKHYFQGDMFVFSGEQWHYN